MAGTLKLEKYTKNKKIKIFLDQIFYLFVYFCLENNNWYANEIIYFSVLLRNRLISAGLEPFKHLSKTYEKI